MINDLGYMKKLNARADHRHAKMNNELESPMQQHSNHMIKNLNIHGNHQLMHGSRLNTKGLLMRQDVNPSAGREGIKRLRLKAPQNQNQLQSVESQVNLNNHGLNSARKLTKAEKIIKLNAQREQLKAFSEVRDNVRNHYFSKARENYRNNNNNNKNDNNNDSSTESLTVTLPEETTTATATSIAESTTKNLAAEVVEETTNTPTTSTTSTRSTRKRYRNPDSRRQEIQKKLNAALKNKEVENTNDEKSINLSAKRKLSYQTEENQDELIENLLKDIEMQKTKTHKDLAENTDLLKEIDSINLNLDSSIINDDIFEDDGSSENETEQLSEETTTSLTANEPKATIVAEQSVEKNTASMSSSNEQSRASMNEYIKTLKAFASRRREPNVFQHYRKNLAMALN
jgi:hypothetical protein